MNQRNISIRIMAESDIEQIMVLKNLLGWNQTKADLKALINFEPQGCFVATQNEVVVGTATTTRYGTDLAWIGVVIVHPEKRRLGIGRNLLKSCLQYLNNSQVGCVKLDATPMGKKLYISFGFRDEYNIKRLKGKGIILPFNNSKIAPLNLDETKIFDKKYFMADRGRLLERFFREFPGLCLQSYGSNGKINGYLMAREGQYAHYIGPVVTETPETAKNLIASMLSILNGKEIILDLAEHHTGLIELLLNNGFEPQRDLSRMAMGNNPFSINNNYIIASSSAEKG